ncbi:MAG: pyridoxamine 5'-phosphate oxidase [Betaproteobacteria bacterium]
MSIANLRKEYLRERFDEADAAADPIDQFRRWFDEALQAELPEPNAMTLATVDAAGAPSARIVLIKNFDARGFVFFTNYESRKGRELAANPRACLLFHWVELERQVRIEGAVTKIAAADSDAYFRERPLGSRYGAWASRQSAILPDRQALEAKLAQVERELGNDPPRPPHWGGYRLQPDRFEFWQGRPSRLHDRLQYIPVAGAAWKIERLSP